MAIIFVKTRYKYDSYTDFYRLAELSGYPLVYVDEMDVYNDNTYIISPWNGEMLDFMDHDKRLGRKATIILWNLERPGVMYNDRYIIGSGGIDNYIAINKKHITEGYFDDVIVSDRTLAEQSGFVYSVMGCNLELGTPGSFEDKEYDYAVMSCYSYVRRWMFEPMIGIETPTRLYKTIEDCSIAPNAWGQKRDILLRKSRHMLMTHQDGVNYIEPLRCNLAMAYGLPIVTEQVFDSYPYRIYYELTRISDMTWVAERYNPDVYKRYLDLRLEYCDKYPFKVIEEVL